MSSAGEAFQASGELNRGPCGAGLHFRDRRIEPAATARFNSKAADGAGLLYWLGITFQEIPLALTKTNADAAAIDRGSGGAELWIGRKAQGGRF